MQDSQSQIIPWLADADTLAWSGFAIGVLQLPSTLAWLREQARERNYDKRRLKELRAQGQAVPRGSGIAAVPQDGPFANWRSGEAEARVTTVVSGKGGVGKSCIALGLLEYYSMSGNVLLVDLDLHNRGLTSIFESSQQIGAASPDTTFSELGRFKRTILPMALANRSTVDAKSAYRSIDEDLWKQMVEAHTREKRDKQRWIRPMRCTELRGEPRLDTHYYHSKVGAGTCHFMAARTREEKLFLSDVSQMDYIEIFLFIKSIAAWARVCNQDISNIVIDCHGAQDMFSVGALLAANHVVVVANEDPGSFEGTAELASIVRGLVDEARYIPESLAFVVNQSRSSKRRASSMPQDAGPDAYDAMLTKVTATHSEASNGGEATKSAGDRVRRVTIRHDDDIRRRVQSYLFPSAMDIGSLWQEIGRIAAPATPSTGRTTPPTITERGVIPSSGSGVKTATQDPRPSSTPALLEPDATKKPS